MVPVKTVYAYTVHNTYLGSIIYGGIWGVIVLFMAISRLLNLTQILRTKKSSYPRQWGILLPLLLIFFLVTGFSIENFQQTNSMQIYLAILAMAERMPSLQDFPNAA
jgi:apolipoprotein N-acyltransferase